MEQLSQTLHGLNGCSSRRKRVFNIDAMCEFDQNEDKFSVYFEELEMTSPKMVRKNIPVG